MAPQLLAFGDRQAANEASFQIYGSGYDPRRMDSADRSGVTSAE